MKLNFKMALIWKKRLFLTYFHIFLVIRGKLQKFLQHIYITQIHACMLLTLLTFLPYQFWKKSEFIRYGFSLVWFLVLILIHATKWWAKFKFECVLLMCVYTNAKFIVICKPRTLNDRSEDSVQYRNCKKHCFLAATIFLFIGKIIMTW